MKELSLELQAIQLERQALKSLKPKPKHRKSMFDENGKRKRDFNGKLVKPRLHYNESNYYKPTLTK